MAFLPMGKSDSSVLIFISVTFEYNLIINVLVIQSFIIDSKNIKLTYKRIL